MSGIATIVAVAEWNCNDGHCGGVMLPTMNRRIAAGAIVSALVIGGLAWLWIARQPATAPTASADSSSVSAAGEGQGAAPWEAVSWTQVENPFGADAPAGYIESIVEADGRLVAGGLVRTRNAAGGVVERAATFVSDTGLAWHTAIIEDGVGPNDSAMLMGLAAGSHGFIAFGGLCCETDARAAWHSTDGLSWRRLELTGIDPSTDHWIDVAGAPGGWLAIVSNGTQNRMMGSVDGRTWSSIELDGGTPMSVAASDGGFVAVGHVIADDESYDGAVWTSPDGVAWSRVAADDPALANADDVDLFTTVPFANGLVVVGIQSPVDDRQRCEDLAMVATTEPLPPVALSCGWGNPMAWHSTDGSTWTALDPDLVSESDFAPGAAVAGGPALVGLGIKSSMGPGDAVVWVSSDGQEWAALRTLRPVERDTSGAIAVRGRTIILAGTHWDAEAAPEPVIWLGTVP